MHAVLPTQCPFTLLSGTLEQDRAILTGISNLYDKSQCVREKGHVTLYKTMHV